MSEQAPGQELYLIWSNEHRSWWGPNCRGYTSVADRAGRYTRQQAIATCNAANYGWNESSNPNELPIPESLAVELTKGVI